MILISNSYKPMANSCFKNFPMTERIMNFDDEKLYGAPEPIQTDQAQQRNDNPFKFTIKYVYGICRRLKIRLFI